MVGGGSMEHPCFTCPGCKRDWILEDLTVEITRLLRPLLVLAALAGSVVFQLLDHVPDTSC